MSLLLLPERKVCYLLPLEKDQSTPRKLLSDLDKKEVRTRKLWSTNWSLFFIKPLTHPYHSIRRFWRCLRSILQKSDKRISETRINEHKWTPSSEVTDRSVLSDELANFCAEYPIYYVEKMKDSMTTTRIQKDGERHFKIVKPYYNSNLTLHEFSLRGH